MDTAQNMADRPRRALVPAPPRATQRTLPPTALTPASLARMARALDEWEARKPTLPPLRALAVCAILVLVAALFAGTFGSRLAARDVSASSLYASRPSAPLAGKSDVVAPPAPGELLAPTPLPIPTLVEPPVPGPAAQDAPPTPTPDPNSPTPTPSSGPPPIVTPPPSCRDVNCNPWGYDFTPGMLIYAPPFPDFCSFFSCNPNFWFEAGYVVLCGDGQYSKGGGTGSGCQGLGGHPRPLYSH